MAQALHPQPHRDHAGGDRIEQQQRPGGRRHGGEVEAQRLPQAQRRDQRQPPQVDQRADAPRRHLAGEPLADDHVAGLAQHRAQQQQVAPVRGRRRRRAAARPWPAPAARCRPPRRRWPPCTRPRMRSPRKMRDSSATAAGMAAMTTPAATAEVSITPKSMQIENRKLPRKLSQNSSLRSCARQRRIAVAAAHPVRHGHGGDAEAQPGQQEDREGRDQQLRQPDIAADHAPCWWPGWHRPAAAPRGRSCGVQAGARACDDSERLRVAPQFPVADMVLVLGDLGALQAQELAASASRRACCRSARRRPARPAPRPATAAAARCRARGSAPATARTGRRCSPAAARACARRRPGRRRSARPWPGRGWRWRRARATRSGRAACAARAVRLFGPCAT